jgi:hypothetical protein
MVSPELPVNPIDNDGMEQIVQSFPHLEFLHLNRTRITGVSLEQCLKMKSLHRLLLYDTPLTADDVRKLYKHANYLSVSIEKEKIPRELSKSENCTMGVAGKVMIEDRRGMRPTPVRGDDFPEMTHPIL